MGECPDWYPALKAAQYHQVPVWELLGIDARTIDHRIWIGIGQAALTAEGQAVADLRRRR